MFCAGSPQLKRSEVNGPDTIIDFFESDIFAGAGDGDVDPPAIPADAAIGADYRTSKMQRVL
jgi:hypothetical protein